MTTSKFRVVFFLISSTYGSSADLLTFFSDRISRAFIRSRDTQAAVLEIFNDFNKNSEVLYKYKSYAVLCQVLSLNFSFLEIDAFK